MRSCSFNVRFKLSTILYKSDEYLIRVVDRTSIFLSMKKLLRYTKISNYRRTQCGYNKSTFFTTPASSPIYYSRTCTAKKGFKSKTNTFCIQEVRKIKFLLPTFFTPEVYMHFRRIFPSNFIQLAVPLIVLTILLKGLHRVGHWGLIVKNVSHMKSLSNDDLIQTPSRYLYLF